MPGRPRHPSGLPVAAAALPLALLAGCGGEGAAAEPGRQPASTAAAPIIVRVEPVARETVVSAYSTSATLRAEKRATVTSRTRGVLEELLVEEGDLVEAGQVLAQLEDEEQELALARAQHRPRHQEARVRAGGQKLNEDRILSDNEVELLRREAEELKHDVALAELNLERTSILAPFDGVVVALRHLDLGRDGQRRHRDLRPLPTSTRSSSTSTCRNGTSGAWRPSRPCASPPTPIDDDGRGAHRAHRPDRRPGHRHGEGHRRRRALRRRRPGGLAAAGRLRPDRRGDRRARRRRWSCGARPSSPRAGAGSSTASARTGDTVEAIEVELGFEEGDRVEILRHRARHAASRSGTRSSCSARAR